MFTLNICRHLLVRELYTSILSAESTFVHNSHTPDAAKGVCTVASGGSHFNLIYNVNQSILKWNHVEYTVSSVVLDAHPNVMMLDVTGIPNCSRYYDGTLNSNRYFKQVIELKFVPFLLYCTGAIF